MTVRYDVLANDISHVFELAGGCGSIELGVEVGLKWKPVSYPKTPHEAELGVSAFLNINECARVCHPMASCGWRGCRGWEKCHYGCLTIRQGSKLGPWSLM